MAVAKSLWAVSKTTLRGIPHRVRTAADRPSISECRRMQLTMVPLPLHELKIFLFRYLRRWFAASRVMRHSL